MSSFTSLRKAHKRPEHGSSATIAPVSTGVGIDYSIHATQRYREELGRHSRTFTQATTGGTGIAML